MNILLYLSLGLNLIMIGAWYLKKNECKFYISEIKKIRGEKEEYRSRYLTLIARAIKKSVDDVDRKEGISGINPDL